MCDLHMNNYILKKGHLGFSTNRRQVLLCVPRVNKSHPVSSEVRVQIRRLLKVFTAHLTGERPVLVPPLTRGGVAGGRVGAVQGILVVVVLDVNGGGGRLRAHVLLAVAERVPHFVGDEEVAGQRGRGGEAGSAVRALQVAALHPPAPVLADVLHEGGPVLGGEAAGSAAEPGLGLSVRSRGGGGGS